MRDLANLTVTVLGGSGFIGSRVVGNLLTQGCTVKIGDLRESARYPSLHTWCDVRKLESLLPVVEGSDVVINLAAEHRDDVRPVTLYQEVNVDGAANVCRAASQAGVKRVLFTSSVAVYGFSDREADESTPLNPFNEYGRTKAAAEKVYGEWAESSPARSLVIVRPTVVFGEENRGNFYELARTVSKRRFLMVGAGHNRKSVAYVGNVAAFLVHLLQEPSGVHVFNYVDKPDMEMNALVQLIRSELGISTRMPMRIPYTMGIAAGHIFDAVAAITKRRFPISAVRVRKFTADTLYSAESVSSTGFVPPFALIDAIRATVRAEFKEVEAAQETLAAGLS